MRLEGLVAWTLGSLRDAVGARDVHQVLIHACLILWPPFVAPRRDHPAGCLGMLFGFASFFGGGDRKSVV